jgi:hypothetical protein
VNTVYEKRNLLKVVRRRKWGVKGIRGFDSIPNIGKLNETDLNVTK